MASSTLSLPYQKEKVILEPRPVNGRGNLYVITDEDFLETSTIRKLGRNKWVNTQFPSRIYPTMTDASLLNNNWQNM